MKLITYKGIEPQVLSDAPFIGARILAAQCNRNCSNCFNQDIKLRDNQFGTALSIIHQVLFNPLHEGIILGGLEWTEQPYDMIELTELALSYSLQVMIYTGMTEEHFIEQFPELTNKPIWCKFGAYDESQKKENYYSHGVKLATSNQYVKYMKLRR